MQEARDGIEARESGESKKSEDTSAVPETAGPVPPAEGSSSANPEAEGSGSEGNGSNRSSGTADGAGQNRTSGTAEGGQSRQRQQDTRGRSAAGSGYTGNGRRTLNRQRREERQPAQQGRQPRQPVLLSVRHPGCRRLPGHRLYLATPPGQVHESQALTAGGQLLAGVQIIQRLR